MILLIIIAILVAALGAVSYGLASHRQQLRRMQGELNIKLDELSNARVDSKKLLGQKKSSEIRTGQIAETLAPFLDTFPYNPKQAHFLGNPIDYIVFADNEVAFVEIKSGKSRLTQGQQHIRNLIKAGKVVWKELRIE